MATVNHVVHTSSIGILHVRIVSSCPQHEDMVLLAGYKPLTGGCASQQYCIKPHFVSATVTTCQDRPILMYINKQSYCNIVKHYGRKRMKHMKRKERKVPALTSYHCLLYLYTTHYGAFWLFVMSWMLNLKHGTYICMWCINVVIQRQCVNDRTCMFMYVCISAYKSEASCCECLSVEDGGLE